jgi:uncharacterized protein (DUF427 family)
MNPPRVPNWLRAARSAWRYDGSQRPHFAIEPEGHQESVWDYPRPPRIVADDREVVVRFAGEVVAQTSKARRVQETASPPAFYLPPEDVRCDLLVAAGDGSLCEWKGTSHYWTVRVGDRHEERSAWSYPNPFAEFTEIRNFISFYPGRLECTVDGQRVQPQPGGFYGGWVTPEIVGPFKGDPGTSHW